jgi:hypothetical protein
MFLGWVIDTNLYSERFGQELKRYVAAFKARELTGAKVFEACDGVLTDEMLSNEGNRFAQDYFDLDRAKYLVDYDNLLCRDLPSMYHVTDTWANYERVKVMIDKRFRDWQRKEHGAWNSLFRKHR